MVGPPGFVVAARIQAVVQRAVLVGQHRWAELPETVDACYVAAWSTHVAVVGQLAVAAFVRTLLDLPHCRQMTVHFDPHISAAAVVVVVVGGIVVLVGTQLDSNSFLFLSRL